MQKTAEKEVLPQMMMDSDGHVKVPFDGLRVLDTRSKRILLEDVAGRLLSVSALRDISVKVGEYLTKGKIIGRITSETSAAFFDEGIHRSVVEFLSLNQAQNGPSNKRMPLTLALGNDKFVRKESSDAS